MADLEVTGWPDSAPLAASPRRAALRFPVGLADTAAEPSVRPIIVKGIAPEGGRAAPEASGATARLVAHGGAAGSRAEVALQLARDMAPGNYVATLDVAGTERRIAFAVVPDSALRIRPSLATIDASGGKQGGVVIGVENRGNVTLTIDLAGSYPLGREEPLAAAPADEGTALAVLTAALARAPRVLTEVCALHVAQPGGAILLAPGASAAIALTARWDHALDPSRRYRAVLPLYGSDVEIAIVTAAKRAPATAPRKAVPVQAKPARGSRP